ncbi:unnamed protein product, partial [Polarella glacialis]
ARAQPSFQMLSAGGAGSATGTAAPPVAVALCRLLSGACGSRLLVVQPPIQPISQGLQPGALASASSAFAASESLGQLL